MAELYTHLDKAKGAMDAARKVHDRLKRTDTLHDLEMQWADLLAVARVQAEIAQAEALESIAVSLERMASPVMEVSTHG